MKILIVEDDKDAALFFSQVAASKGFHDVDSVESAEEALAQAINTQYDLITLDVRLPGASGLEVLSVMRNMYPHAIIAIISGHLPGDINPDIADCADVVLKKPLPLEKLHALLESAARIQQEIASIRALEEEG